MPREPLGSLRPYPPIVGGLTSAFPSLAWTEANRQCSPAPGTGQEARTVGSGERPPNFTAAESIGVGLGTAPAALLPLKSTLRGGHRYPPPSFQMRNLRHSEVKELACGHSAALGPPAPSYTHQEHRYLLVAILISKDHARQSQGTESARYVQRPAVFQEHPGAAGGWAGTPRLEAGRCLRRK